MPPVPTLMPDEVLKLVHSTQSFSVWNRAKGPVFWYALGVPGPFYINVEQIIGKAEARQLLDTINTILAATTDLSERAKRLTEAVMSAYNGNTVFRQLVATMAATAKQKFTPQDYGFISGGERRDWFFSIPLAQELSINHVFLFKDKRLYSAEPLQQGAAGIHVADLINNAASYFDAWLPIMKQAWLACSGTICVIARGSGAQKLADAGIKVEPLQQIDLGFFEQSAKANLIDAATLKEISIYLDSPAQWASEHLMDRPELFDAAQLDPKSFQRMQAFFAKDPWNLRAKHAKFFAEIDRQIAERVNGKRDIA